MIQNFPKNARQTPLHRIYSKWKLCFRNRHHLTNADKSEITPGSFKRWFLKTNKIQKKSLESKFSNLYHGPENRKKTDKANLKASKIVRAHTFTKFNAFSSFDCTDCLLVLLIDQLLCRLSFVIVCCHQQVWHEPSPFLQRPTPTKLLRYGKMCTIVALLGGGGGVPTFSTAKLTLWKLTNGWLSFHNFLAFLTLRYRPPDVLLGSVEYTGSIDMWSVYGNVPGTGWVRVHRYHSIITKNYWK